MRELSDEIVLESKRNMGTGGCVRWTSEWYQWFSIDHEFELFEDTEWIQCQTLYIIKPNSNLYIHEFDKDIITSWEFWESQ